MPQYLHARPPVDAALADAQSQTQPAEPGAPGHVAPLRLGILARARIGMSKRAVLHRLASLRNAGLTLVDGDETLRCGNAASALAARVDIRDARFWPSIALAGTVGAGEAYAEGWWDTDDLEAVIRMFAADLGTMQAMERGSVRLRAGLDRLRSALRPNTRSGARAHIAAHYDLGNEFYRLWLDPTLSYSACCYADAMAPHADPSDTLDAAAIRKLDVVCQSLALKPGEHLVEIGTGWGGLAVHAAARYGVRVTTTTISRAQHDVASARVREAGLSDRVTVLQEDYRDLPQHLGAGCADKLVSIEMIEAIGMGQFRTFFATVQRLLNVTGLALVQTITVPDQRFAAAARDVDFIKRHIFPGCCIPGLEALAGACRRSSDLSLIALRDLTADYARTLRDWRARFTARQQDIRALGPQFDTTFLRLWDFYLAYCAAGFAERALGDVQLLYARPGWRPA